MKNMKNPVPNIWWLFLLLLLPLAACADRQDQAGGKAEPTKTETVVAEKPAEKAAPAQATKKVAFKEGVHYIKLPKRVTPAVPAGKIEVVEMFSYSCPHCFNLEPHQVVWKAKAAKDVFFRPIPSVANPAWAIYAKAFYAAESLGVLDKTHEALFKAIHEQGRRIRNEESLVRFFASLGVDEKKFRDALRSGAVEAKVKRAEKLGREYGVTGVPSLIVDGQYRVLLDHVTSYEELFSIVDFLVDKVRADRSASG